MFVYRLKIPCKQGSCLGVNQNVASSYTTFGITEKSPDFGRCHFHRQCFVSIVTHHSGPEFLGKVLIIE